MHLSKNHYSFKSFVFIFTIFILSSLFSQTPYFERDTKDTEWRIENQVFGESMHIGNDQSFPYLSLYGGGTPPKTAPNIVNLQNAGNGYYYISSKERPNSYLEAIDTQENSQILYSNGASGDGKKWKFELVNPKGFYKIVNKLSGKCLTVYYKPRKPSDWDYYLKRLTFGRLYQNDFVTGKKEQLWNVEPIRLRAINCIGITQLGWAPNAVKLAVLNKTNYINPPSFTIKKNGTQVFSGTTVFWGGRYYQNFYTMNLSSLTEPGEYELSVDGESATFAIADDAYFNMRHRYGNDTTHVSDFFDTDFGFITNWGRMENWYTDYRQMEYKLPNEKVDWTYPYWQLVTPHSFDQDDLTYTSTGVNLNDSAMGIGWNHTDQQWSHFYPMSVTLHYLTQVWNHNIDPAAKTKIEKEIAYGANGFIGFQNSDGSWPKATFISQKYSGTIAGLGMALAASVETLQSYDANLANQAKNAAIKAWSYVEAHNTDSDWVPYDTQCYRWGFAETRMGLNVELYILTGETKYKTIAEEMINNAKFDNLGCWVHKDSPNTRFTGEETYVTYSDEAFYEMLRYYEKANPNETVKANIIRQMKELYARWANDEANNTGPFQEGTYYDYGDARYYMQRAIMLYNIYRILGDGYGKGYYLAEQKMDWVVGYNSFGTSLTSGIGDIYACPPFASGFYYGRVVPGIIEDPLDTSRLTASDDSYNIGESDSAIPAIYLLGNGLRYELRNSVPDTVSFFTNSSYSGAETKFTGGKWAMQTIKSFGCDPLSIKSIKVHPGFKVTLFDDDNFTGNSQVYYFDTGDLGYYSNKVKSFQIERLVANAMDDSLKAVTGKTLIFDKPGILYNDEIPVNSNVTILTTNDVSHGTMQLNADGSLTYHPDNGFTGVDSFSYRLFDGKYTGQTATVTINVLSNNPQKNLALEGTAEQSTTDTNNNGYAAHANDGNTSGDYNDNSLSLTLPLPKQWWTVDLGQPCDVERVKLFNRNWPDGDDFADFYIFVSKYPFTSDDPTVLTNDPNVSSFFHAGPFPVNNYTYPPVEMQINAVGRFVRVQLTTTENKTLDMAEVEVYGNYKVYSGNTPPTISSFSPPNNATFVVGSTITLTASGTDFEDGTLSGTAFSWASNLDGNLGTGSPTTANLSQGVHTITLTATDSGGETATEIFKIFIGDGFNPVTIPGCVLWLDADDIDGDWSPEGTAEDGVNGTSVVTWHDKSETGHNATQTDSAKQGTLSKNALNNKDVVSFSQQGHYYEFPKISDIRTVFWIIKETTAGEHFLLGDDSNFDFHRGNTAIWSVYAAQKVREGQTYLNGAAVDGVHETIPTNQGALITLITTGNATASRFSQDRTYANRSWIGDAAEILIYNRTLSVEERETVEAYLQHKWLGAAAPKYTLTVSNGSGSGEYTAGSQANISANTAPNGQIFDRWTGDISGIADITASPTTCTMPAQNISITATYKTPPPNTYSISGTVSGAIKAGVTITIDSNSTTTDGNGKYTISGLQDTTFTVIPTMNGYTFSPVSQSVNISGSDKTGVDFTSSTVKYTLTVNKGTGGGQYAENDTANISATVPAGKVFKKWTGDTQYLADANAESTTVTMPAQNITVTAKFIISTHDISGKITGDVQNGVTVSIDATHSTTTDASGNYTLTGLQDGDYTITPELAGYTFTPASQNVTLSGSDQTDIDFTSSILKFTLTVNDGVGSGQYPENDSVNISAAVPAGQIFDKWTGDTQYIADANAASTTVTMPAQDITLNATFKQAPPNTHSIGGTITGDIRDGVTITLNTGQSTTTNASGAYTISGLSDGAYTVTPTIAGYSFTPANANATVSGSDVTGIDFASAVLKFTLTVNSGTGGGQYKENDTIQISATPPAGQVFDAWTGDVKYVTDVASSSTTLKMPAKNITVTATFRIATHNISGKITGDVQNGVTVSIDATHSTTTDASGNYTLTGLQDGDYTITPVLTGYTFTPTTQDVTLSGSDQTDIDFTSSTLKFTLTVNAGTGTGQYAENDSINISATLPAGQIFDKWTGDTQYLADTNASATTVSMPAQDITVTATFKQAPPNTHSIDGTISGDIQNGVTITLDTGQSTTTNASGTYTLSGLSDGSYTVTPTAAGYSFTPANINATIAGADATGIDFTSAVLKFSLTVNNGTGGGQYKENDTIQISATPPAGQVFDAWTGDVQYVTDAASSSTTLKMPAKDITVTATFRASTYEISGKISGDIQQGVTVSVDATHSATTDASGNYTISGLADSSYTVTPSLTGYTFAPANRSVTISASNKTNINFTSTQIPPNFSLTVNHGTGTGQYPENDSINISATIPVGQIFDTWTGDTQYLVNASAASTTVTMPAKDITITATFKQAPPNTHSISGKVSGDIQQGVTISLNTGQSTATNASGIYAISGLSDGNYTVTPSLSGYTFSPANENATVSGADVANVNFSSNVIKFTLTVHNGTGGGQYAEKIQVSISATVPTGQIFNGWTGDTQYVANANSANTTLRMPAKNISVTATFKQAPPTTYSISGAVSGVIKSGVKISVDATHFGITNASGNYTITALANGTYKLTPTLTGYNFTPSTADVAINGSNATAPTFISSIVGTSFTISGKVADTAGNALSGVTISLDNGQKTTTDTTGAYSISGLGKGSYKITPFFDNYTFAPSARSVIIDSSDVNNIIFTGHINGIPDTNTPPVAADDSYYAVSGQTLTVQVNTSINQGVLSNDVDTDNDPLSAIIINQVSTGVLTMQPNGSFSYTPPNSFNGDAIFTYVANDGVLNSNEATVTIRVLASGGDIPSTAVGDKYTLCQDSKFSVDVANGVLANDLNATGKNVSVATNVTKGVLDLNSDGSFEYTPETGFSGITTFEYQINDGVNSSKAIVALNVIPVKIALGSVLTYNASDIPALKGKTFSKAPKLYGIFAQNGKKGTFKKIKTSTGSKFSGAWGKKFALYDKKLLKNGYKTYFDKNRPLSTKITVMVKGKTDDKLKIDTPLQSVQLVPPVITDIQNSAGQTISEAKAGSTIVLIGKYFGNKAPKVALEVSPGKLSKCKVDKSGFKHQDYKGKPSAMNAVTGESSIKIILPSKNLKPGLYPIVLDNKTGIATTPYIDQNNEGHLPMIKIK